MGINEKWIPSQHYSSSRGPYNVAVFHTTEGAMTIEALGSWFQNPSAGCSSHHGADQYSANLLGAYVYESSKAWTQASANPWCLSLEMCAYASWSESTWMSKPVLLDNAADWLRYICGKYAIPYTLLSDSQAQSGNYKGICQHVDFGSMGSGHHDAGSGFPIQHVINLAKSGSGGSAPPAEEDEGMYAVAIPPGAGTDDSPDVAVSLDKTSYTKIGLGADISRLGSDCVVKVRVAWRRTDGSWGSSTAQLTASAPRTVVSMTGGGKVDTVSFRRQDNEPITLYPNFA